MKKRILVLTGAALIVAVIYLSVAGSVIVDDETGDVVSTVITNDLQQQPLTHFWGGYFFAIPKLEGTIEIRCRSGSRNRWGYVTTNIHTKVRVTEHNCRKMAHA